MLEELLKKNHVEPAQVIRSKAEQLLRLDLSKDNMQLAKVNLNDENAFTNFIFNQLGNEKIGIGGYGEDRSLYSRSDLFEGEESRSIHLGIDIWTKEGTEVFCPLDAIVHSFANRNVHGDYGPVIILEHKLDDLTFHSLFGHLSRQSLDGLYEGKELKRGQQFAWLGTYEENFHWPPHLHFQLIMDMQGYKGDYPGVCKESESTMYLANCPNPKLFI